MRAKKNNPIEWRVETLYFLRLQPSYMPLGDPIGGDVIFIPTGDLYKFNFKFINQLIKLGVMDMETWTKVPHQYLETDPFSHVKHDTSILDKYIDKRPTWDEYFMGNAHLIAARSTCDRLYVGCVLVRENHIIATGYNGSVAGAMHCDQVGHLMYENSCKRTIHAEKNAINMASKLGISTKGATAYVTHYPCPDCMKELNQAGIKEVIYAEFYKHKYENDFHEGMTLREFNGRPLEFNWVGGIAYQPPLKKVERPDPANRPSGIITREMPLQTEIIHDNSNPFLPGYNPDPFAPRKES